MLDETQFPFLAEKGHIVSLVGGGGKTTLLHAMAARFENTYVLDLRAHAPVYDKAFHENFFLGGHMNAAGYLLTAKLVIGYIDYIIRHNMEDFSQVGFIGTGLRNRVGKA